MYGAIAPCIEDLPPRVRHAGRANNPAVALCLHGVIACVAVGHQASYEAFQEDSRAFLMTADGEVEHVDRRRDAPIDPHSRGNAATRFRLRSRDHLAGANVLRVVVIAGQGRVFHDERHCRVVGADDWARPHHLPEVRYERTNEMSSRLENVQERAPGRRPAVGCEEVLPVIRGPDGRATRVRYVLPRHKAANWVGRGRGRKSTRPGANGVVELSPFEFLDRLADLVPPPRKHRHRYHGLFAPNHKLRRAVTALAIGNIGKRGDATTGGHGGDGHGTEGCCDANPNQKPRSHDTSRIAWAKLMARVGEEFPLECPACGGDIRLIAFITEPWPIRQILTHLGEPLEPPPVSPARGPPTDWYELVQAQDDRDVFQASSDELPAIGIHSL